MIDFVEALAYSCLVDAGMKPEKAAELAHDLSATYNWEKLSCEQRSDYRKKLPSDRVEYLDSQINAMQSARRRRANGV